MRLLDIIAEYLRAADYVFKFANCDETIELFQGKKHESGPHIVNIDCNDATVKVFPSNILRSLDKQLGKELIATGDPSLFDKIEWCIKDAEAIYKMALLNVIASNPYVAHQYIRRD